MIADQILSIVVREEAYLASILSSEAVKSIRATDWLLLISDPVIWGQNMDTILSEAATVQNSIITVINAAATKEIAIAAKINAVKGNSHCI